ncbi:hypothetical protein [Rubellicoccus peritrichatus]|uniref:Uncharacterized protein n=1 Tax=Rubellicoccus peritrichatus TaxID=3080537 RepID=A0AAQ3L750_9BACT|nr:hypothetical protein [Puniceicoccus sp. CR14]WOO40251.1 hypothetical protein RZN69_16650 [Puniceicoccus sp. CR14]
MKEYKFEILPNDGADIYPILEALEEFEIAEQTSFDGKRFLEAIVEFAGQNYTKFKEAIMALAHANRIKEIVVRKGEKEVIVRSVRKEELQTVEEFISKALDNLE